MSDEDRDVDIESDEDDQSATQFMTQAEKRAHHNALERKRRDHIKESFHGLRDVIPSLQGEKSSRAQILKQATEYIDYMTTKNLQTSQDIEDLKRQNGKLETQVRAFEKAKATGKYAAAQLHLHTGLEDEDGEGSEDEGASSDEEEEEETEPTQRKKIRTH